MANVKVEEILKYCKEKNITIPEEQMKLLEGKDEISEKELKNVAGGCGKPDCGRCPKCNSSETYSSFSGIWFGNCEHCGYAWIL